MSTIADRFLGRNPIGYVDRSSLYRGYFVLQGSDPYGLFEVNSEKCGEEFKKANKKQNDANWRGDFPNASLFRQAGKQRASLENSRLER